ncbi:MAG TPA: hypothetical protein VM266_11770, partial [Solirubrobacteraceae bacterium]|nr:hypothetical protein [Solirubrobacteraceae bacterium]
VAGLTLVFAAAGGASAQANGELRNLSQPKPEWLTPSLEARIIAAGARGSEYQRDRESRDHEQLAHAFSP